MIDHLDLAEAAEMEASLRDGSAITSKFRTVSPLLGKSGTRYLQWPESCEIKF